MEDDGKILLATSWAVKNFLIDPGTVIDVGPFGVDEIVLRVCARVAPAQPTDAPGPDWVFAKCRLKPTKIQQQLLEQLAQLITPGV